MAAIDALKAANKDLQDWFDALKTDYESLKQRIADAEKQEPVCWYEDDPLEVENFTRVEWNSQKPKTLSNWVPLYALPPIPPNVAELQQKLSASEADVKMLYDALRYAIDDLVIRAELQEDDSLDIGQGCLDQMNEALAAVYARKRRP